MGVSPRVKFYLVHQETGQRYPVGSDEVVIGRSSGDLVFPDDPRLSSQHCRIVMTTGGLGIHDMGSANGTYVDGKQLEAKQVYSFKVGSSLTVGQQTFKLQEAGYAKKLRSRTKKRRLKKDEGGNAFLYLVALAALGGLGYMFSDYKLLKPQAAEAPPVVISPYEMADRETRAAFDLYKKLGAEREAGKLSEKQLAIQIRAVLIPTLQRVQLKLSVVRGQTEYENRKLELNRKMVAALIGQVTAMADLASGKDEKAAGRLQKFSEELQALSVQMQQFKRQPAQY